VIAGCPQGRHQIVPQRHLPYSGTVGPPLLCRPVEAHLFLHVTMVALSFYSHSPLRFRMNAATAELAEADDSVHCVFICSILAMYERDGDRCRQFFAQAVIVPTREENFS